MKRWRISRSQRKTALKMVRTIFDRLSLPREESSRLLMDCFQLALRDLLDRGYIAWTHPLPRDLSLEWAGSVVSQAPHRKGLRRIRQFPTDQSLERAYDECESLFDRHDLDEDERDTLFTALPCLGLLALENLLEWKKKPPFPEVN